jgi:hypothetical protein
MSELKISTLKDFDVLLCAVDSFIKGNGYFESSMVINSAMEELENCTSLQQCFSIPIQHKLFNMETSLKWVFFLTIVPKKLIELNPDEEFMQQVEEFKIFTQFSPEDAMQLMASIYDVGVQDVVLSHLDDSDSESEDDDDNEDGSEDSDSEESDSLRSSSIIDA